MFLIDLFVLFPFLYVLSFDAWLFAFVMLV